ncbi:MAG TPA: M56 family metallopeptidase, partial [Pirellulales bacterium]|nr:M56 family metallopeptidase [Pirellulales bacterium]
MSEILSLCVEFLNRYGESFWSFASGMFVQVTVLVLALLVLELLLRNRVRAVVRYAVWLLVLVKLVLPVDLRSPASVAYWLPTGHAGNSEPLDQTLDARLAGPAVDRDPAFADRLERTEPTPGASAPTHETAAVSDLKSSGPLMPMPPIAAAVPPTPLHWRGVIFGIWILAVVALLAMVGKRALWVRRIVRQATDAARELEDQLHECLSLMGMKRRQVAIKTTDRLGSPAICGLWRPTILLPRGFPGGLDREQIRMVFVHELVHWRRGDLQVNCFQTLFQILYFYSPAVWIANLYIRRLREQAVDETVLVALHGQSERYAATLLDIASATLQPAEAMLRLIGVVESRRAVSTRIRHILQRPTPRTAKLGLTGLAVIAASGLLLLPMGQRDRAATADDRSDAKASATSDHRDSESKDASKTEPAGQPKGTDVDGDPLPVGAIARLGTKRFRSDCRPVALTYLADGKTLAQIASDTSHAWLQHWDANSGRLLDEKALSNHVFFARAASPAGNLVAIYNSHIDDDRNESIESVRLLNLSSGERVFDIKIQERHSEHLTLSPNARFLAYSGSLAGRGEMLHLIDTGTQAELISRKIDDRVESMAFSPDGQMLGIGVYSGKLLLWNWSGKEEPRSINLPQDNGTYPVGPLVFSTEGTTVAVVNGNRDFKGVPLIDTASGRIVRTFVVPEFEHHNSRTLVFSPDGTRLAATTVETSGGGVALWDVLTGKPVRHLSGMFGEPYYLA